MKPRIYPALGQRVESNERFVRWTLWAMAVTIYAALIWAAGR